jgi:hypothetical protein
LLSSVRAEGRAISQSLLPLLETIDNAALPDLGVAPTGLDRVEVYMPMRGNTPLNRTSSCGDLPG